MTDRPSILYDTIKHHIKPYSSILDVGCGYAPLAQLISDCHPNVDYFGFDWSTACINVCKSFYPQYRFKEIAYEGDITLFILQRYDIVLHLGIESWKFSPLYHIHNKLLKDKHLRPDSVLIETLYRADNKLPYEAYQKVQNSYLAHKYSYKEHGKYEHRIDDHHYEERRWCLLRRGDD